MPSMEYSLAVEQELINDFVQRASGVTVDTLSMRRFGQFDPDEPVSMPFVSTKFIIDQPRQSKSQQPKVVNSSISTPPKHHPSSGVPPLPSGRYKKHLSDPTRNNGHPIVAKSLMRDQSSMSSLSRSKSCGEGRSSVPSEEFDVLSTKANTQRLGSGAPLIDKSNEDSAGENGIELPKLSSAGDFKCGALCIYLPGFSSKKKPVQAVQGHQITAPSHINNVYEPSEHNDREIAPITQVHQTTEPNHINIYEPSEHNETKIVPTARASGMSRPSGMSRVPSLERFDLSSISSRIITDHWDEATGSRYFDLPMELIQTCDNETDAPVTAGFVFEKERRKGRRSSRRTSGKVSHEKSSHRANIDMRSSGSAKPPNGSSYPARNELNAFVEAQSV
ncbi:hypothetical protein LUZ60_010815 [Juncus effusus]|nr:hypothetical protein LUZ60_010815 [Juncus effusus]